MTDLVLDDLITWPETGLRAPGGALAPEVAGRPISWAVGIRPTTPVLPTLRGQEIVVISHNVLQELESAGGETVPQLFAFLAKQPVSGLIMDHEPQISPPQGLPILLSDMPFAADVESFINRLITERRAALYSLGSTLARELSSAALAGATLDDVLDQAARTSGYALALVNRRGSTIGRSTAAPAFVPGDVYQATLAGSEQATGVTVETDAQRWLVVPVESHALPEGVRLAVRLDDGRGSELARLTANQTADALRVLFDRSRPLALDRRDEHERTLGAFFLGKLSPDDSRVQAVFSRFDLAAGVRLALFFDVDAADGADLGRDELSVGAWLDVGQFVAVVPARYDPSSKAPPSIVSQPVVDPSDLPSTLRLLQVMGTFVEGGQSAEKPLFLDHAGDIGVAGLLLQFLVTSPEIRSTAAWYCHDLLDPLLTHDSVRDAHLVASLRAYLEAGRVVGHAADQLAIHRNTLAYRLSRIRELTGCDPDDPATALQYQLALVLHDLLDIDWHQF